MRKVFCVSFLCFSFSTILFSQRQLDLSQYKIIWEDNFDYKSIADLFDPGPDNNYDPKWKNGTSYGCEWCPLGTDPLTGQKMFAKADRSELTIEYLNDNAFLHLKTGRSITPFAFNCANESGSMTHTCASIASSYDHDYYDCTGFGNIGFQYGIFEIRAKIPGGFEDQSAFWLWGVIINVAHPRTVPPIIRGTKLIFLKLARM